jgi:D-alanyl-D-alanine carboxypeptidase (penicillin-binding protein 5/6)
MAAGGGRPAAAADPPPPPLEGVRAALLMDARSGQVLYALHGGDRVEPASLTKIMTFDLALDALSAGRVRPDTPVTVSRRAWDLARDPAVSRMFLQVGSQVPFRDLLYGLMVVSGADAAVAVAEELAGSEEAFVAQMNAKAREIGLADTHFANSHGLEAPDQYTTAYDVARLTRYVLQHHPESLAYTSVRSFTWNGIRQDNWNLTLLAADPRVNGFKTGHLAAAGYHVVATARQGQQSLIAVVLGAPSEEARTRDAEVLLDWGFTSWDSLHVDWRRYAPSFLPVYEGEASRVALSEPEDVWVSVPRGSEAGVAVRARLDWPVVAPVQRDQPLGWLTVVSAGRTLREVPLLAAAAVPRGGLLHVAWDAVRLLVLRLWAALPLHAG